MTTLNFQPDEILVGLYAQGDNEAFDVLLSRYKDRLYSYINYIVRNDDVAEDIFQETFVKAIITIRQNKYHESGKFYAWLTRIAHNLIIDFFRVENANTIVSNDEVEYDIFNNAKLADACIENSLVNDQILNDVRNLMNHLPESQRDVVYMRYYKELSFKEIAELTGVSINTALGRMRYAIMNMRRMAEEHNIQLNAI